MNEDTKVAIPSRIGGSESDLRALLVHMNKLGGSDLFLLGGDYVWVSCKGRKIAITSRRVSDKEVQQVLQSFYGVNAPSKLGGGSPIDTSYEFFHEENGIRERLRYRVNAVGCLRNSRRSLTVTIREIPTTPPRAEDLGIEEEILKVGKQSIQGLILVVGATGNGKSTLLASMLRNLVEEKQGHNNLVTIESPIEFVYDEVEKPSSIVTQLEENRDVASFSEGVRNSLRMAPTHILVGESRDYETVSSSVEASTTGHVVFSTAHANNVAQTFQRLISTYPERLQHQARSDIVEATKMVVAQRLVKTKNGGRTAVREYLILNQEIKEILLSEDNIAAAAAKALREHGRPMSADLTDKFNAGIIDEDVYEKMLANY